MNTALTAHQFFHFCPHCGASLTHVVKNGQAYLQCNVCDFTFFQNPVSAVCAIIPNENGEVLLVERAIEPDKGEWDIPGGFVEHGEEASHAIVREMKEELGVVFTPTQFLGAYHSWYDFQGLRYSVMNIYYAGTIDGIPEASDDISSCRWFDPHHLNTPFEHVHQAVAEYLKKS